MEIKCPHGSTLCWWCHYKRIQELFLRLEDNARECRVISPVVKNVKREKE
jgi:hypothetical protein